MQDGDPWRWRRNEDWEGLDEWGHEDMDSPFVYCHLQQRAAHRSLPRAWGRPPLMLNLPLFAGVQLLWLLRPGPSSWSY